MRADCKKVFVILTAFALATAAGACGKEAAAKGTRTYTVSVDAPSPAGKNMQFASFFPSRLRVRPGDSIVFGNRSTQAPHTVSFGIKADRSDQPSDPDVVTAPCYVSSGPSATLPACPEKAGGAPREYAGTGFWNSGFLVPSSAPSGPKNVKMRLSRSIAAGTYLYVCIIHRPMIAAIEVVPNDEDRQSSDAVVRRAAAEIRSAKSAAGRISDPARSGSSKVTAGWGVGAIAVNRLAPQAIDVKVGTKVSWYLRSSFEPHTITFGSTWRSGEDDPASFAPSGLGSGARYSGGLANSGIVRPGDDLTKPFFSLVFIKVGTYNYVCVLHPGMDGVVNVS
jgi:plastocyanin